MLRLQGVGCVGCRTTVRNDAGQAGTECETCAAGQVYQFRVKSHLNSGWSGWFEGLAISHEEDGTTLLTGAVADQPALHGLLIKIRDLGLPLLSINPRCSEQADSSRLIEGGPAQQPDGGNRPDRNGKGGR